MWKPCGNVFEYHRRKGFGGFAKVVTVHSRRGGYPISCCGWTVQMKVFHLKEAVSASKVSQGGTPVPGWQYPGISCTQQTVIGEQQTSAQ